MAQLTAVIDPTSETVAVEWPDGARAAFPYLWLRDNCPSGFHPQTLERAFDLLSVPADLRPLEVRADGEALEIAWSGDGHVSRFDAAWLSAHRPGAQVFDPADVDYAHWRGDLGAEGAPRGEASALLSDDAALLAWLKETKRYGLSLVTGLADDPEAGMAVAKRIGFLRQTNFGVTFDVISKPDPNNLAYTSHRLPLHTDLTNQEVPPGFQFLHCMINEAEGGGSLFCDGFAVAEDIRAEDPEAFALLRDTPTPFRFQDGDYDIRKREPVIRLERDGRLAEIRFNAHLAAVFDMEAAQMAAYYRAYRLYMTKSRDDAYLLTLKLRPGEMAVFDNRRVLHGRDAFDPSTGGRRLRGCYVDRGEFDSRIRVLSR